MNNQLQKRVVIVEFITRSGMKRIEGISCKARVDKFMSAVKNEAKISIANLNRDDIDFLTTFTSPYIAIAQRKRIRIFAGYENSNVALLFDGDIVEALPTSPPDRWLNIKAISGHYNSQTVVSKSILKPVNLEDLAKEASEELGLALKFQTIAKRQIESFGFNGGLSKFIDEINNIPNIIAFEDLGVLNIIDKNPSSPTGNVKLISEDTGMIGLPEPTPTGVKVKTLLDTGVALGGFVEVKSNIIKSCNGIYQVRHTTYDIATRENPFYSIFECRRL